MSYKTQQRGFSIMEILIVVAICVFIMSGLAALTLAYDKTIEQQGATIRVATTANSILNTLEPLIMQADAVLVSHQFNGVTYSTGTSTLVVSLPSIDSSGNVVSGAHDYAVVYSATTSAYRILVADASSARISSTKTYGTTLKSLTFSYDTVDVTQATKITIDVQTETSTRQKLIQSHLNYAIRLRN
jgi:hypothetical protein